MKKYVSIMCVSLLAIGASADLQHRWSFDADTTDSVGGATLDIVGGSTVTGGAYDSIGGDAFTTRLEATGADLTAIGSTFSGASAVSFEFWINQNAGQDWSKLLLMGSANGNMIGMTPRPGGFGNATAMQVNDAIGETAGVVLNDNTDYYVAGIYDGTADLLTVYVGEVGGTLANNGSTAWAVADPSDLVVDAFFIGGGGDPWGGWPDRSFDGQVDEIRIWDHALNESEVDAHFAAGPNVIPEPSTLGLLGVMGGGLLFVRRRFKR